MRKVYINGRCRKLTPIECERLQTLPDNYTSGVADGGRYNVIGNGWTVNVIVHLIEGLKTGGYDDKYVRRVLW
jgi:DNA (cytosine-5)-methyltransferase 3A